MGTGGGDGKDDARRSGRERVRAAQEQQKAADRRRRQLVIGGVVVAVLALAALIGVLVSSSTVSSNKTSRDAFGAGLPFSAPSGVSVTPASPTDPGGIVYGANPAAPVTLQIWEDVRCPYCKLAESTLGQIYQEYANAGKIRAEFHLVDLIDRNGGGSGSLFGGNALACAQDAGSSQFLDYHNLLYLNQPSESNDAYGNLDNLLNIASQVPGLRSSTFDACVRDGKYAAWVKANYDALGVKLGGSVGTPALFIDGTMYQQPLSETVEQQQAAFRAALDAEIAKKG
jgi:protein-disulfide isomerase